MEQSRAERPLSMAARDTTEMAQQTGAVSAADGVGRLGVHSERDESRPDLTPLENHPKETTDLERNCTIKDHLQDILNSGELRLDFHINTEGAIPERRTSQVAPGPKPPLSCWPPTP